MTPSAGTVTKKKLSPTQAAEQWAKAKRQMEKAKPLLEEAEPIVLEHFAKTGKTSLKDVVLTETTPQTRLDQDKVKQYLGKKLAEFQYRTKAKKKLALAPKT